MGDEGRRPPPLARRVPGATRAGPADADRTKPPELPESFRKRIQAVVSAAHAARETESPSGQAARPDQSARPGPSAFLPGEVPGTPGTPKPLNGLLRSMLSDPLSRGHLSDADSEFDTAPIPRVAASGAIASPEASNGAAAPAPPAAANGAVKPAPAPPKRAEPERAAPGRAEADRAAPGQAPPERAVPGRR